MKLENNKKHNAVLRVSNAIGFGVVWHPFLSNTSPIVATVLVEKNVLDVTTRLECVGICFWLCPSEYKAYW